MTRSVIVGMDDTDDSRNALARAAELARVTHVKLVVVHVRHLAVFETRENLDVIEAMARENTDHVLRGTGLDWEFVVRNGDPAHELMDVASQRSATAIVVGGRPHRAPASAALGSVTAALVHRFHGSVLVVRTGDSDWHQADTALSLSTDQAIDAIYGERMPE